jgi:hypothetical protein
MNFVGEIVNAVESPEIDRQQWITLISYHPNLVIGQPREMMNPFTRQPITLPPRRDVAHVIIDGKDVGLMSWAEDDSNLINVYGEPDFVIPVAEVVARSLGGRFKATTSI